MIINNQEKVPQVPFTTPPPLFTNSMRFKLIQDHYSNSSTYYSSFPSIKTQNNSNNKKNKIFIDRLSNEYSEPFDYLFSNTNNNSTKINQNLTLPSSNSKNKLKLLLKSSKNTTKDSDSAYSSQSSQSTPKIYNNIWDMTQLSNDLTTAQTEMNKSTTTLSSSSHLVHLKPSFKIKNTTPMIFPKINKQNDIITKPVLSEYESVKDSIDNKKNMDRKFDLQTSFKSTITAFDVLSERCVELIGLFDSDNEAGSIRKKKEKNYYHSDSDSSLLKATNNKLESKYVINNSRFLERTLLFNNFMSSSVLLTSLEEATTTTTEGEEKEFGSIRCYILRLAKNSKSIFAKSISEFISCSITSREINPNVLMSNMRQFMNGMKNYLLNNPDLKFLIEKERDNLCSSTEIINIDCVLEDCLQLIVLKPLKAKIYYLIVDWLINDGSLVLMNKNIKYLTSLNESICIEYLNLKHVPTNESLNLLRIYYNRMQCEYAPLVKLKYILFMINELLTSLSDACMSLKNNDFYLALQDLSFLNVIEFLPIVIYALCKCNMSAIQIEIDYIWSLVNKQLLNNECIYYLTLMSSACYVLRNLDSNEMTIISNSIETSQKLIKLKHLNLSQTCLSFMESGLLEIYLIDNFKTIQIRTIPVKPGSKCKEVNSLIASKFKVFNCEEYALYCFENDVEKKLKDDDQPLEIKNNRLNNGVNVKFIFKQKTANIITKYC
jgi:hypothetical protein